MRTILITLAKRAAIVLLILLVAGIATRQAKLLDRRFIFFPEQDFVGTPRSVGLDFENVRFSTADGLRLHGWFVPGESDVTLVWFHGNAGNISHRIGDLRMLHERVGVSVFIFDYRGYGFSEGKASEKGTYRDAEAALDYLRSRQDVDVSRLVFFGRSLGCAVAVELATRHQAHAVILESPFDSIRGMAERLYPYLPVGILIHLVQSRYDSLSKIKSVRSPLMVVHGDRDEMIPISAAWKLFDAANAPKRFYTIEGAMHNNTYQVGGSRYFDALRQFVDDPISETAG